MIELDHAVVNVLADMDEAVARYAALGFHLTPRGYHTLGSINHLAVFDGAYLELLGYAPGEREKRAELWVHPPGLTGLAFRVEDAAVLHEAMSAQCAPVEPFKDFSRPVSIAGQEHQAAFRTFQFDRARFADGRIFFCQHLTPELIWRRENMTHENGVTKIEGFHIAAQAPDALRNLFSFVPDIHMADAGNGFEARLGETQVYVDTPRNLVDRFGSGLAALADSSQTRMVALDLRCSSRSKLLTLFGARGIAYEAGGEHITVPAQAAMGCALRFIADS